MIPAQFIRISRFLIPLMLLSFFGLGISEAQSQTSYSTILDNSNWNVDLNNQLAYGTDILTNGFSHPFSLGDQTTWGCQLGVSGCDSSSTTGMTVSGVSGGTTYFTGSSTSTIKIGVASPTTSYNAISGKVLSSGAITMLFTPTDSSGIVTGGENTLGLGQVVTVDGIDQMQMQMISGTSLLVTHWAYMTPYSGPNSAAMAPVANPPSNGNPSYSWTSGTVWKIVNPNLFGTSSPGKLIVSNYRGGYFWGYGVGPSGNPIGYTQIGSITPEGKVLFAALADGSTTLNTSYGSLTDVNGNMVMNLADYDSAASDVDNIYTGSDTVLTQIIPYTEIVFAANNPAAAGAAANLWSIVPTTVGLSGAMAPVLSALDNYSAADQSNAISQTLPLLVGAASQATANSQRIINQFVLTRQNILNGQANGEEIIGDKKLWGKVYGSWGDQSNHDNIAGYSSNTGGVIFGADRFMSPLTKLGAFLGFSNSSLSSNNYSAPNNLSLNSYHFGVYGDHSIKKNLNWNYQLNGAFNRNTASRNISFYGVTADSSYNSYTSHLGSGLQQHFDINERTRITPTLRADYLTVQSNSYVETKAEVLNLSVNRQAWNELYTTAGIKLDYKIMPQINVSANFDAGYNLLNQQIKVTSRYAGGGGYFTTYGLSLSPWLYSSGVGISGMLKKNIEVLARYDLQTTSSGYLNQIASARIKFYM